jgi:DNA-binding LacI/PurR family transcriptional regulator
LLKPFEGVRPDGLVITDDHLVKPVVDVVRALGIRVPQDLAIVSHWNYPLPYQSDVPIRLLGFDARERLALGLAAMQSLGKSQNAPPLHSTVLPRFADEVEAFGRNDSMIGGSGELEPSAVAQDRTDAFES